MSLLDYQNYRKQELIKEGLTGDITLPALAANITVGKSFNYQTAIDTASGAVKAALENEAIFLLGVLKTKGGGVDVGTLGEYMVANVFGGTQTNPSGGSSTENTIFYDVSISDTYLSVKTSLSANTPGAVLNSSRLKRNNVLSIFSSNEGALVAIDNSNIATYAMRLYEYVNDQKTYPFPKQSSKFGFGLVYIKDNKFQVAKTSTVTKDVLLDVLVKQWDSLKKTIKDPITEQNVVELFLDKVMPKDNQGRLTGDWSASNIIKYFGGSEVDVELSVEVTTSADRDAIIKYLSALDTDVLKNFAVSQGYK